MEFTLLWAALTAAALGWVGLRIWDDRLPDHAGDRLLGATLMGLAVGRVVAMIAQGVNPITHPSEIIVVRGGVSTAAAVLGFIVGLLWSTRKTIGALDAVAPAVLLALAGWHAGCLWTNGCLGTPSDLPWAWAQEGSTVTRHPVELYAAIALALGAYIVSRLGWRPWLRAGTALGVAGLVRLGTELLRPSLGAGPVGWYLAAILIGGLVAATGDRISQLRSQTPT